MLTVSRAAASKTGKAPRINVPISEEGYRLIQDAAALGEETLVGYARRVLLARAREDLKRSRGGSAREQGSKKRPKKTSKEG